MDGHLPVKGLLMSWVALLRLIIPSMGRSRSYYLLKHLSSAICIPLCSFVLNAVEKAGTYPQSPRFSGLKALEDTGKYLLSPFFLFLL